jgi:hypothetical protein
MINRIQENEKYNAVSLAEKWLLRWQPEPAKNQRLAEMLAEFALAYNAQTKLERDYFKELAETALANRPQPPIVIQGYTPSEFE